MIGAHGIGGCEIAADDGAHEPNEGQLVLGPLDLAAEQRDPSTGGFRLLEELECVAGGAGGSTEDADDDRRVVLGELGDRVDAVERHLEEEGSLRLGDACQRADNRIIDKGPNVTGCQAGTDVGVEHLEEVPHAVFGCFAPERRVGLQRREVVVKFIVEGDGVEQQIAESAHGWKVDGGERT